MAGQDYYAILGVERSASQDDIRRAYRKRARIYHPDVNPGNKSAEEKFKEISVAYEVLGDPEKRKRYDEFGEQGLAPGFDPEKARTYQRWQEQSRQTGGSFEFPFAGLDDLFDFSDIFEGRRRAREPAVRGEDIQSEMEIDFLDAVRGFQATLTIQKPVACPSCAGSGIRLSARAQICPECNGSGLQRMAAGAIGIRQRCSRCQGKGKLAGDFCRNCAGTGRTVQAETIRTNIPPAVKTDQRIRVPGKGAAGFSGGPPGDLYIVPRVRAHPLLIRTGNDLTLDLPITIGEALNGGMVEVPTPMGRVKVIIPDGAQSGQLLRIRGKGVRAHDKRPAGDLYLRLMIRVPKVPLPTELADRIARAYTEDVRKEIRL